MRWLTVELGSRMLPWVGDRAGGPQFWLLGPFCFKQARLVSNSDHKRKEGGNLLIDPLFVYRMPRKGPSFTSFEPTCSVATQVGHA